MEQERNWQLLQASGNLLLSSFTLDLVRVPLKFKRPYWQLQSSNYVITFKSELTPLHPAC